MKQDKQNNNKNYSSLPVEFNNKKGKLQKTKRQNIQRQKISAKKTIIPKIRINGLQKNKNDPQQKQQTYAQQMQQIQKKKGCLHREKSKPISKKKINFQINYSNYQKQYRNFGNLFIHGLKNLSCDQRLLQPDKQDPLTKGFPLKIVNILYGQHINNYNPYVEALDKLYQADGGKISKQKMQRIKKLCYIGIAKNYFKSQKYSETPKYRRVNILIRTYMYSNMRNIVEEKAQNYENIVFIPCNKGSLSFSHKKFPQELIQICSPEFYQNVIQNVNRIIQNHYINYKKINTKQTVTDLWGQNFAYFLTILFFLIFVLTNNIIFTYALAFMIAVSIVLYITQSLQTLSMLGSSKNIIQKIQNSIENHLRQINTHNMQWKVGQDFYWLEIHYIRKKKKKLPKYSH